MATKGKKTVQKPKGPTRPYISHGGKKLKIPLLSGAVGVDSPPFRAKFPTMPLNATADVQVVEYYLSMLESIQYLTSIPDPNSSYWPLALHASGVVACWDVNLPEAIRKFQAKVPTSNPDEAKFAVVFPDGPTLKNLVDYGDYAEKLADLRDSSRNAADFIFYGSFDMEGFIYLFKQEFSKDPNYTEASEPHLRQLLGFMISDPFILDIRWMAYILATIHLETTARVAESRKNAKGKTITVHPWRTQWGPVEETGHGQGKAYRHPVKVIQLADGTVQVTQWDGNQYTVAAGGTYSPSTGLTRKDTDALAAQTKSVKAYNDATGTELTYFGRGYVQLTWWYNYASAGVLIGKGLALLLNPELAEDPETAYKLMSLCLRTGKGFANGHKLGDYIYGATADYVGARHMVNGTNENIKIANDAKKFQSILMECKS